MIRGSDKKPRDFEPIVIKIPAAFQVNGIFELGMQAKQSGREEWKKEPA